MTHSHHAAHSGFLCRGVATTGIWQSHHRTAIRRQAAADSSRCSRVHNIDHSFDPDDDGDYNSTTASAVPDSTGRFTLPSDALTRGKRGELRLFPLHVNGSAAGQMSQTRFRYSHGVARDGTPDLSSILMRQKLAPFITALTSRNQRRANLSTSMSISKESSG